VTGPRLGGEPEVNIAHRGKEDVPTAARCPPVSSEAVGYDREAMVTARRQFHEELETLELDILSMGELAEQALGKAMEALDSRNADTADKVIAGDDEIDDRYLSVERRWLELLALQTPVASDLRLVSVILHVNLHLERIGDMAVNIAKIAKLTSRLPANQTILSHLKEMADVVRPMLRTSLDAFVRRDLQLALSLPRMDDPVDRLNRGMYREVAACAGDPQVLEWAIRMMVVSRQLERVGDHAVDIAEQVAFLLTGEFQEFTDASHPDGSPADGG
jgi:phosphate transport system protein